MKQVIVFPGGIAKEVIPARDWHWGFSWKNWRIGASFQDAMWEFDFLWFYVWCDRYDRHGDEIEQIPPGVDIIAAPNTRLSDLQAVGATVRFVPKETP